MTRRARLLLDALEDGRKTRAEFYAHAGRYFIVNNSASELRRAGIEVVWDHATDTYHLLGERLPLDPAALVEETSGQLSLEVAA